MESDLSLVGVVGFEPTEWRSQSPLPYHLATPQNIFCLSVFHLSLTALTLYHKKKSLSTLFLNFFYFFLIFLFVTKKIRN